MAPEVHRISRAISDVGFEAYVGPGTSVSLYGDEIFGQILTVEATTKTRLVWAIDYLLVELNRMRKDALNYAQAVQDV